MEIETKQLERCDVVALVGRVDASNVKAFAETFASITAQGRYNIVLNMKELDYISSAGLSVLIETQKTCKTHGGELVLAEVQPQIKRILELAGLHTLIRAFANESEAVGSF